MQFVDANDIDYRYFERPYFLVPADEMAGEGYAVIRDALRKTAACCSRSATCRRPKPKRPTTGSCRSPPQSPLDSNETASEEVGTVQKGGSWS